MSSAVFCGLVYNPPYTTLMEMKSVVHYLVGRTVINLELFCHIIGSRPAVIEN
jgi:hypothetical protein